MPKQGKDNNLKRIKGPGYVYVLQNKTYADYTLKVGLTLREPDARAKEIFYGATGVPEKFNVAVAFSVADCEKAEKDIHRLLKAYRFNRRREFFRIPPSVAEHVVHLCCKRVNEILGVDEPQKYEIRKGKMAEDFLESASHGCEGADAEHVHISRIRQSPLNTSVLTAEQKDRIAIFGRIFDVVLPDADMRWMEDFTRDSTPEREIAIWEHMAHAFMSVDQLYAVSEAVKHEAFKLLLARSLYDTNETLQRYPPREMSLGSAKRMLSEYGLQPMPLIVARRVLPS